MTERINNARPRRLPIDISADMLHRAQRGEVLALHELLQQLEPYVGRICGSIALDEGEDAAQETLLIIFKNLETLHEPKALASWARTIATRESIRIARRTPLAIDQLDIADVSDVHELDLRIDVRRTLERLSPEHRAVLVLSSFEDMAEARIAEHLDVSPGTVKSRLSRARNRFREEWRSWPTSRRPA